MSPAVLVNVVGFFLGAVLYGMLLAMALGAGVPAATDAWAARWRSPASRLMILTGLLGLLWNIGALTAYGFSPTLRDATLRVPLVIAFAALGFLPAVVVHSVLTRRSRLPASRAARLTFIAAYALSATASVIQFRAAWLGEPVPSPAALTLLTAGFVVLILALLVAVPRRAADGDGYEGRAIWVAALSVFAVSAVHLAQHTGGESWWTEVVGHHASLLLALAILSRDYRFAFADIFLKRALTLTLLLAIVLAVHLTVGLPWLAERSPDPSGAHLTTYVLALALLTASLQSVLRRTSGWFVDTVILRRPDYARLPSDIAARLANQHQADDVFRVVSTQLADALDATWVRVAQLADASINPHGAIVRVGAEADLLARRTITARIDHDRSSEAPSDTLDEASDPLDAASGVLDSASDPFDAASGVLDAASDPLDAASGALDSASDAGDSAPDTLDSASGVLDATAARAAKGGTQRVATSVHDRIVTTPGALPARTNGATAAARGRVSPGDFDLKRHSESSGAPRGDAASMLALIPHAALMVPTVDAPRYVFLIGQLLGGRRLLSDDLMLLESIAVAAARRLDALRVAHERIEATVREQQISRLATEAELRALRAQLNPHFLFNALTTVGYLIQTAPDRAMGTLLRLTSLLRGVLRRTTNEFSTLGDELELIEAYLEIEQARFEERLRVTIDVAPALRALSIPSLLVQPLVENAVKHGIAPSVPGGEVIVAAFLESDAGAVTAGAVTTGAVSTSGGGASTGSTGAGEQLRLSIRDTGVGTTDGALARGRARGVGISSVEHRLRVHYGNAASLRISSLPEVGTTVDLVIPVQGARKGPSAHDQASHSHRG